MQCQLVRNVMNSLQSKMVCRVQRMLVRRLVYRLKTAKNLQKNTPVHHVVPQQLLRKMQTIN